MWILNGRDPIRFTTRVLRVLHFLWDQEIEPLRWYPWSTLWARLVSAVLVFGQGTIDLTDVNPVVQKSYRFPHGSLIS